MEIFKQSSNQCFIHQQNNSVREEILSGSDLIMVPFLDRIFLSIFLANTSDSYSNFFQAHIITQILGVSRARVS